MIYHVLTNNQKLITNFLKSFSLYDNKYENLIITIDNKHSNYDLVKAAILSFSHKIKILKLTDIEDYAIKALNLKNYKTFVNICPIQAKLLIPFYFKWVLKIDKFFMFDDDILVNCNIESLNLDQYDGAGVDNTVEDISKFKHIRDQLNACNELLDKKFVGDITKFPRFVVCAFIMTVYNDYAEYIFRFFNSTKIYEYIRQNSNNFVAKQNNRNILYPFEEHCLNVYIISHAKKFMLFKKDIVFHYWGQANLYEDKNTVLKSKFIHAVVLKNNTKNDWYNFYFSRQKEIKQNDKPIIVYCLNDNKEYIKMMEASADSILRFCPNVEFHVIINSKNKISVSDKFVTHYFPLNTTFRERLNSKDGPKDRLNNTSYLKLWIPEILKDYKKCLFVDCDCLCFEDINNIYSLDIPYLAESEIPSVDIKRKKELGIDKYYSTGIILMNLEALRNDNFREKCFASINSINCSFWCHEETLINKNYYNKITPFKSNVQQFSYNTFAYNNYEPLKINSQNILFLHFGGPNKSKFWEFIQYSKDYKYFKDIQYCKGLMSIEDFESKAKTIYMLPWNKELYGKWFEDKYTITTDITKIDKVDCAVIMASPYFMKSRSIIEKIVNANKPIISLESSFISSIYPVSKPNCDIIYKKEISYTLNNYFQFEANYKSTLKSLLEKCQELSEEQKNEIKQLKQFIIDNQLSKYNCQFNQFIPINSKPSILVIDQAFGDQSIVSANATNKTFENMLIDAIIENPEATIYLKMHPESMNGGRHGFFNKKIIDDISKQFNRHIEILNTPVNPISLLSKMDKIYVVSSGLGFEALLCNKKVITYGCPFYAGWGLTEDRNNKVKKQQKQLTFDQLFYTVFLKFTKWINPETGKSISMQDALFYLNTLKNKIL